MVHRHTPPLLALLVLLALLAACGAAPTAMPTVAPTSDAALREPADTSVSPQAMPTVAAAAAEAPAAGDASAGAGAVAPEGSASSPTAAPAVAEGPERPLGQEASLRAGEIDDNAAFAAYLDYLTRYSNGDVRRVDVSERYRISVIDDSQRPVLDARVTVFDGERALLRGRTYAGGELLFFPRLFDTGNAASFRVVAEHGQARAEATLERGEVERLEIGLRGVQADSTLRLDLLFLLDTTGSMGDELTRIQTTIDSIAGRIDAFVPRPSIRYGLVAYKDEGDEYVTRTTPFTSDLAAFRTELGALSAFGGGDTPEALDEGLYEAVVRAEWSEQPAVRLVFLVGDAGPHVPGRGQFSYLDGAREAAARGVKIYPIAASNTDPQAEYVFRQLAQQTMAGFLFLTYQPGANGGAPGESTTLEAGAQAYTVERLDDLIVGIVERELGAAVGAR
jgi:Mg-chelatase subunit ChlD